MKILITGCAGYIGSVLTSELLYAGHAVIGVDNLLHGPTGLLSNLGRDGFRFKHCDVCDTSALEAALEGCDAVVHLAAIVGDPACARAPELATSVNRDASLALFDLSQKRGVERFVFASTCSNYGRMKDPTQFVTEETELRPVSLYAETKVEVEKALLTPATKHHTIATVLRFATIFGISPRMRFDLTVNEFTRDLHRQRELVIFGEQFWRPYVHVRDAARAIRSVLEATPDVVAGNVFNVGDASQNYQKGQLVELIASRIGGRLKIERVEKNEDPRDYRVSFDKIQRELDFHITRTVDDGIKEIIDALEQGLFADSDNPAYRN
jgi:nucleoside-diphosphate-sugar epimerase